MRRLRLIEALLLAAVAVTRLDAQTLSTERERRTIGASLGVSVPVDLGTSDWPRSTDLGACFELPLAGRFSVRAEAGRFNWSMPRRFGWSPNDEAVSLTRGTIAAVATNEGPRGSRRYTGFGIGRYRYGFDVSAPQHLARHGWVWFSGGDVPVSPRVVVSVEAQAHMVGAPRAGGPEVAIGLSIGVKRKF